MSPVQEVILSIFKEVKTICERHGIPYYAVGGTCIGAARHKGFIPWDDDLDIAIPIERFLEFLRIARQELPDHLYVYDPDEVQHNHFVWAKVCNRNTAFIEVVDQGYEDAYKGVFVDIMPISGVPIGRVALWWFKSRLKFYAMMNQHARFPDFTPTKSSRILSVILKVFRKPSYNKYSRKYLSLLASQRFCESKLTSYTWHSDLLNNLLFPSDWFINSVELPFEDTFINCPGKYHEYLTCQFGDYMTPPPVDKQHTHSGIIDLEHSYKEYSGNR